MKNPDELLKQLRIGNYLNHQESECVEICSIQQDNTVRYNWHGENYGCYHIKQFTPITLTEEWLLKFGFKKNDWFIKKTNYSTFNEIAINLESKRFNVIQSYCIDDYCEICLTDKLEHVHQLQNLYFALTGEELTYNP